MSYSQNAEEKYILEAFAGHDLGRPIGRFLEIGAYHPFDFSNTRALYELGWSGVMIEPAPGQMMALLREYGEVPRITLIQAAIGLAPRLATLRVTDDALSTVHDDFHERAKSQGYKYYGSVMVAQLTLERLFMEVGNKFDFVSIDVEGGSADLCLRYLELVSEHPTHGYNQAAAPKCIIVEHDFRADEIAAAGASKGYRVALKNGENLVLVRG